MGYSTFWGKKSVVRFAQKITLLHRCFCLANLLQPLLPTYLPACRTLRNVLHCDVDDEICFAGKLVVMQTFS